jgi:hypothetical protein
MAFIPGFVVSQGLNVQNFSLQDTSSGDPNIIGRTISLFQTDNSLLGGSPIAWPLSDGSTKTINGLLTWDFSLLINVVWTSSSPIPGSTYIKSQLYIFTGNSNAFAYSLVQQIASNQAITRDTNYLYNLALVNSDILNAIRCNDFGDQGNSQECLNRIYNFYINRSFFF